MFKPSVLGHLETFCGKHMREMILTFPGKLRQNLIPCTALNMTYDEIDELYRRFFCSEVHLVNGLVEMEKPTQSHALDLNISLKDIKKLSLSFLLLQDHYFILLERIRQGFEGREHYLQMAYQNSSS
jgi:hypothetical protein